MVELIKDKNETTSGKRAVFQAGQQASFIKRIKTSLGISNKKLAEILMISPRSLSDWIREKTLMTMSAVELLCGLSKIDLPKNIGVKEKYWYTKIGATLGGTATYKKHGFQFSEIRRKEKWREWWQDVGKFKHIHIGRKKSWNVPPPSSSLAEFFGIMIGDGGINKYQCFITLNSETDLQYAKHVKNIFYQLFHVEMTMRIIKGKKALLLYVSRKGLNDFLCSNGLKSGHKLSQNLDIPGWIMKDAEYKKSCLRGIIDTDGCIFYEVHKIKGKTYSYPRLNLVTGSLALAQSSMHILSELNLDPCLRSNGRNYAVQVENKQKICNYFEVIGSSNPKHVARWLQGGVA